MHNRDHSLNLQPLFDELRRATPEFDSPEVEQALQAACRTRGLRQRRTQLRRATVIAALAACLALALFWRVRNPAQPVTTEREQATTSDFIALPYAQSGVPLEQAIVVRMDLQPSQLQALGLPSRLLPRRPGVSHADLLIGQDGVARAVRFAQ